MRIELKKFGNILNSRPDGREAYLAAKAYLLPKDTKEKVEIDFSDVAVLGPSWGDEFLTPLKKEYGKRLILLPSHNSSVRATVEFLGQK